jgi:hypothetical protein
MHFLILVFLISVYDQLLCWRPLNIPVIHDTQQDAENKTNIPFKYEKKKVNICRPVTSTHGIIAQVNIHWLEQTIYVFICLGYLNMKY